MVTGRRGLAIPFSFYSSFLFHLSWGGKWLGREKGDGKEGKGEKSILRTVLLLGLLRSLIPTGEGEEKEGKGGKKKKGKGR